MGKPNVNLGNNKWSTKSGGILGYEDNINKNVSPVEFDFSRASSGTTVNRQGLIELVDEGAELVVDGNFLLTGTQAASTAGTYWTTGAGWAISNGKATCDGTNGDAVQQPLSTVNTALKQITFTISDYQSGKVRVYSGGGADVLFEVTSNGTYTYTDFLINNKIFIYSIESFIGSISNISVKEVLEEYPRIDFSDDVNGALLLEPQSTNLIKYSEGFSNSYWVKSGSNVVQGFASPDGALNAYKLVEGSNNGNHRLEVSGLTVVSSKYNVSIYVKSYGRDEVRVTLANYFNSATDVYFNLKTKSVILGSEAEDGLIEVLSDGWFRCSFTSKSNAIAGGNAKLYIDTALGGSNTYQGNGASGVYIYGAQLEALPYATSYIPNYGNASGVTRVADTCNNGGQVGNFNSIEGVLYADMAALSNYGGLRLIQLSDGTDDNRVSLYFDVSANTIYCNVVVSSSSNALSFPLSDATIYNKLAIAWKTDRIEFWINGIKGAEDLVFTTFAASTLNNLDFSLNGSYDFQGKIKDLRVYRTALTDDELVFITRPSYSSYESMSNSLEYKVI
jgi:hypothetical protein